MLGTTLGTILMVTPNKYPPTKLVQIKSKGGYWFVQVTKPNDVYAITGGNKTARLSTKTKDKRQADLLWRPKETELIQAGILYCSVILLLSCFPLTGPKKKHYPQKSS